MDTFIITVYRHIHSLIVLAQYQNTQVKKNADFEFNETAQIVKCTNFQ